MQDGSFGKSALEVTDFQAATSAGSVANFAATSGGWYSLVLPDSDYTFINLVGITQFRLHFGLSSDNNNKADFDTFFAGDASAAKRPVLVVEYSLP